jgi:tetratricopeptide (TPR) repeat protein
MENMQSDFDLIIAADDSSRTAEFRLLDGDGAQVAYHQADFNTIPVGAQRGLFDLRNYISNYVEPGQEAASVAEIGVCIAEKLLGEQIFLLLWGPNAQRTLRIQLPGATESETHLAAALARVPWEIARPGADKPTLADRNLIVRVVHDMRSPAGPPVVLEKDECLRVLFIFAEARGSRPLAARLERRALRAMFEKRIYPGRRIVADFLTHGVTRERLRAQVQENGGYHVVHWSGHGNLNLLELAKPGGARDLLSGSELLDLFVDAGGFIPRLFFLSACHSGDILRVSDWSDFFDLAQGKTRRGPGSAKPGEKESAVQEPISEAARETKDIPKEIPIHQQPGYTGTAHALLQGGVASVVAMRYSVGDDYARDLAVEFYDALLAYEKPMTAAASLTMARRALREPAKPDPAHYDACDHATPVLYGAEQPGLVLPPGRSPALDTRDPRLHRIAELTAAEHDHFVGRTWELADLGADFIGATASTSVKLVAVITGLGGMGKTALTAEALALWESRFQWVLIYQAKPNPLSFDVTLSDIHMKLYAELGRYHDRVQNHPADAIYRTADSAFTGPDRLDRLTRNLLRALRDEPILLVLDNFETNLKPKAAPGAEAEPMWACQDPAWDRCLALLAKELVGTPSRVLINCRRPLASLAGAACHRVRLGPLPPGEAALYLREHVGLSKMVFGGDAAERALAMRLLTASRFHPLLMDRLARLAVPAADGRELRPQLLQALDTLENSRDYSQLPVLFAAGRTAGGNATELAYLDDALAASLDQIISDASPDARRLLWMVAVANGPVSLDLLRGVWSGDSAEQEQMRQIKQMLEILPDLPPELQEQLKALSPEFITQLDGLPEGTARPDPTPLLGYLAAVGLVTEERSGPEDTDPDLTCHELVRERIRSWMDGCPQDRDEPTENAIRLAYAARLEAVFHALQHRSMAVALEAGSRALVYCVQAGAYEQLGNFASGVVTSTNDPRLLAALLPHLEAAAASAPEGPTRWRCLSYLADALSLGGRPDASLPYYEQAAEQARATAELGRGDARRAWADVGGITGNWAYALYVVGDLEWARQRQFESAEAKKKGGMPLVSVIGSELEALRIDIMQGNGKEALRGVEERLALVEDWWRGYRSGEDVPDPEYLARVLIGALDIVMGANFAQKDWDSALVRIDRILEVKRGLGRPDEDIAVDRLNRAMALASLGRFGEALSELEDCLRVFENDRARRVRVLSSLASLFDDQGDYVEAIAQERRALALREQLPDPSDRATSHNNLANYLERSGAPSALAESQHHQLAALVYRLVSGLGRYVLTSLHNYTIDFRRAQADGTPLAVPTTVAELLADPAFRPLDDWLRQRQVDLTELQTEVDQFLEAARQAAQEPPQE